MPGKIKAPAFTPLVLQIKEMKPMRVIIENTTTIISTFFFITTASPRYFQKPAILP